MFWLLQIVTNRQFAKAFGQALWRPVLIPIPVFVLNAAFSEERAKVMTEGQKVIPKRTLEYGFQYKYQDIDMACRQVAKLIPSK
jgi:NAD dependent epimerase/dehydratase family enzyme